MFRPFQRRLCGAPTVLPMPMAALLGCKGAGGLSDDVAIVNIDTSYVVGGQGRTTLRQDLSATQRNGRQFHDILVTRGQSEIAPFTAGGAHLVLEWARKLRHGSASWAVFAAWQNAHPTWPTQDDAQTGVLVSEAAMAAGAHSPDAWRRFVGLYERGTGGRVPIDLLVLAGAESCGPLVRAHVASRRGTGPGAEHTSAVAALRALHRRIGHQLIGAASELRAAGADIDPATYANVIRGGALQFKCRFLYMRHVWTHMLATTRDPVSDAGYIHLLSTCGAHQQQNKLVSVDTMQGQAQEYFQHYLTRRSSPYNSQVIIALAAAYGNCFHKDTVPMAAELLALGFDWPQKREILKVAFTACSQLRDAEAFNTLEDYARANDAHIGMGPHIARRRAYLHSHSMTDELWVYFQSLGSVDDRRVCDIVFRWLEVRAQHPGHLVESTRCAEDLWLRLHEEGKGHTSAQLEAMLSLYGSMADRKAIAVYQGAPRGIVTPRAVALALRALTAIGLGPGSAEAAPVWDDVTPHTLAILCRDDTHRRIVSAFTPDVEGGQEAMMRGWFAPWSVRRDGAAAGGQGKGHLADAVRCTPHQYLVGGDWTF